jgi:NAD-dependent SIR2 family protein deacetylase
MYRFIKEKKGKYTLLIGAGLSRESGIKTSSEIIVDLKRKIYKRYHPGEKPSRKKIDEWTNKQKWFKDTSNKYSAVLDKYFPNEGLRRDYFRRLIKGKEPKNGHRYLTNIINAGYIGNILTTNFDELIERSLYEAGLDPMVVHHQSDLEEFSIENKINVIKLHGDYLYDNIANIAPETKSLNENMKAKLQAALENRGLIIIGYSGNDESIKSLLIELIRKEKFLIYGLYWGIRKEAELNGNMEEIISLASKKGSSFFKIRSAGQFFMDLNDNLDLGIPPIIDKAANFGVEVTAFSQEINKRMEIEGNLVERPLITRDDIGHCFFKTKPIANFMKNLKKEDFRGTWILKSPAGTGKTSLLTYVCIIAKKGKFGNRVVRVKNIPVDFEPSKFSSCLLTRLNIRMRSKKRIMLIFDDIQYKPQCLGLIKYISKNYKNVTIISSIQTERFREFSKSLTNIPSVRIVNCPGYLDAYKADFKNLIKKKVKFIERKFVNSILKKEFVTFSHFTRLYTNLSIFKMAPSKAIDEFNKSLKESFLSQYEGLSEAEKLTVKVISWCEEMPSSLLYLILKAFKIKPKTTQRLLKEKGIIYREKENRLIVNRIYKVKFVKTIEQMKEVAKEQITDFEKGIFNSLLFEFMNSEWKIKRESTMALSSIENKPGKAEKEKLKGLVEEIKGNLYCANCGKYFGPYLEFCPQCGRNLITGKLTVICEKYNNDAKIAQMLGLCKSAMCAKIPSPNKRVTIKKSIKDIDLEKLIIPKFNGCP